MSTKISRPIGLLFAVLAIATPGCAVAQPEAPAGAALSPPLVVNVDAENPPFMSSRGGYAVGLYPAILRVALARCHDNVHVEAKPWKRAFAEIDKGLAGIGGLYKNAERLARYDLVLVGGAALPADVAARSSDAGINVFQSYGMSETCGGCVIDGLALPGVQVAIGQAGRVSIGGPVVFSGYRGDPQETAAALVEGRLLTNDRGEWLAAPDGEPRLRILGRMDDVVISGGVNVDLAGVQRAVDGLGRGETAVIGVPDDEWGARVTLVVTGSAPDLAWWQDALRPVLEAPALPRRLLRLASLPRTRSGKVDRQRLRELALAAE